MPGATLSREGSFNLRGTQQGPEAAADTLEKRGDTLSRCYGRTVPFRSSGHTDVESEISSFLSTYLSRPSGSPEAGSEGCRRLREGKERGRRDRGRRRQCDRSSILQGFPRGRQVSDPSEDVTKRRSFTKGLVRTYG